MHQAAQYKLDAGVGALVQGGQDCMHNAWEMRWIAQGVGLMHWGEWDSADEGERGVSLAGLSPDQAAWSGAKAQWLVVGRRRRTAVW